MALVFIAAAIGKLLDLEGSRQALRDFGLRESFVGPGAWLLPAAELAVAGLLLTQPLARIGAAGALLLLAAFVVAIGNALRRGQEPDCHCFGQLHSEPAGRGTIVRNVLLAVPAVLVLAGGSGDLLGGGGASGAALIAGGAIVAALAVATFILFRENRELRAGAPRSHGAPALPLGTPAPELSLRDERGASLGVANVLAPDRPTALVFVSPGCGPCNLMLPHLSRWQETLAEQLRLVVISTTSEDTPMSPEPGADVPALLYDVDAQALELYRMRATPTAMLVDRNARIASSPVSGIETIEALLRTALRRNDALANA